MVSRRKLEEEIARSKDPVLRKQLQELLEKRSQRWTEKEKKAKGFLNRKKKEVNSAIKNAPAIFLSCFVLVVVFALILRLIFWLVGYDPFGDY